MGVEVIDNTINEKDEKKKRIENKINVKRENEIINKQIKEEKKPDLCKLFNSMKKYEQPEKKPILKKPEKQENINDVNNKIKIDTLLKELKTQEINDCKESKEGIRLKGHSLNILSMFYKNNPDKRKLLHYNLNNNSVINDIIDEEIIFNSMKLLDKRIRFFLHYGLEISQTETQYKALLKEKEEKEEKKEEKNNIV